MNTYKELSLGKQSTTRFPKQLVKEFSKEFFSHDFAVMEDPAFSFAEFDEARDRIIVCMRRASQNFDELMLNIEIGGGVGIAI